VSLHYLKFIKHKASDQSAEISTERLALDKETERLVNEVKRELQALRAKIEQEENRRLLKTYHKMLSTLD